MCPRAVHCAPWPAARAPDHLDVEVVQNSPEPGWLTLVCQLLIKRLLVGGRTDEDTVAVGLAERREETPDLPLADAQSLGCLRCGHAKQALTNATDVVQLYNGKCVQYYVIMYDSE